MFERLEERHLLALTTLSPVADTFTRPGVGAGSAQVLDALDFAGTTPGDRIVYIRFDLTGIDLEDYESATLVLHKVQGSRNDTITTARFDVYGLTNAAGVTPQNWDEATLAEGNVGAEYTGLGGTPLNTSLLFNLNEETGANVDELIVDGGNPQKLTGPDLMTFLQQRAADNGLVTFITNVDANNPTAPRGWGYGSRENVNVNLRPTLVLDDGEPLPDPYPENPVEFPRQMEYLDRGLVAVRSAANAVYIGWRLLGTDPADIAFNLYRSEGGAAAVKLNALPLTQTTDFVDTTVNVNASNEYFVRPVVGGIEQDPSASFTVAAAAPIGQYLTVPLQIPAGGTTPDAVNYSYTANDGSVGDLDGDGDYEIVLKWDPTNSKDNSQSGYTGNVYIDAYDFDLAGNSTLLWRIDLGRNIRAGAHYTQFLVYDFDGDGRAEVVMRTAPGTIDGQGEFVIMAGDNPNADYRNSSGYILTGPEYLTVFDGLTGAELSSVAFSPPRGAVSSWGDDYGNRVDRFLAAVAYLDGERPSIVMTRGYYAKTRLTAYDWRDGQLTQRWEFDSTTPGNGIYAGQGNHNLSVADVDGDGYDEIVFGAMVVDDNGLGVYATGYGHGDAMHVSDMDPTNPGLEVWQIHEPSGVPGADFRDAQSGQAIFVTSFNTGEGPGRGVAADVWAGSPGYEMWGTGGLLSTTGANIGRAPGSGGSSPSSPNFLVWWDADRLRELLDGQSSGTGAPRIDKYGPTTDTRLLTMTGAITVNGTKANPVLSADILGDWREEVIVPASNNASLRVYTTIVPAVDRIYTLMHDRKYRLDIAWQNVAYNQPPHPSFFLGDGMAPPPVPNIYTVQYVAPLPGDFNADGRVDAGDYVRWRNHLGDADESALNGAGDGMNGVDPGDYALWKQYYGTDGTSAGGGSLVRSASFVASNGADDLETAVPSAGLVEFQPSFTKMSNSLATGHGGLTGRTFSASEPAASSDLLLVLLGTGPGAATDPADIPRHTDFGDSPDSTALAAWDAALADFVPRAATSEWLFF